MSTDESSRDAKRKRTASQDSPPQEPTRVKSAFQELMYQAKKPKPAEEFVSPSSYHSSYRDVLAPYIIRPEKFGPAEVIRYSDTFTVIHDAYPKATIHILVMPRDKVKTKEHPVAALKDRAFAEEVRKECESVRELAAKELKRRFGGGKDWLKEIRVGVHANPSLNNMHIHVISRDMNGRALKKRNHYNSFCTPFFIPLETFFEDNPTFETPKKYGEYLSGPMHCWSCGKNFDNKFAALRRHLETEFEGWKKVDGEGEATAGKKTPLAADNESPEPSSSKS